MIYIQCRKKRRALARFTGCSALVTWQFSCAWTLIETTFLSNLHLTFKKESPKWPRVSGINIERLGIGQRKWSGGDLIEPISELLKERKRPFPLCLYLTIQGMSNTTPLFIAYLMVLDPRVTCHVSNNQSGVVPTVTFSFILVYFCDDLRASSAFPTSNCETSRQKVGAFSHLSKQSSRILVKKFPGPFSVRSRGFLWPRFVVHCPFKVFQYWWASRLALRVEQMIIVLGPFLSISL